jgi:hypothetical protein
MIAALLLAAAAPAACPVEQARYALRADPAVTARFHAVRTNVDWRSGLVLEIRIGKSGRSYWMLPWNGGTDERLHVRWIQPPGGGPRIPDATVGHDLDFFSTDSDYAFQPAIPVRGGKAPAHVLLPDLGRALWMLTESGRRDYAPKSFFDLARCAPPAETPQRLLPVDLPRVP